MSSINSSSSILSSGKIEIGLGSVDCRLRMFGFRLLMGRGCSVGTSRRRQILWSQSGAMAAPAIIFTVSRI